MSTLNVANISDDQSTLTGSGQNLNDKLHSNTTVDTKYVTNGCAKAWSCQQGDSNLLSSLNVTSVIGLGSGSHQINITNNFENTNYATVATGTTNPNGVIPMFQTFLVGSFKLNTRNANKTSIDAATRSVCFGDLA